MPVCNRCNKTPNCLTIDPCDHCGAKDWKPTSPTSRRIAYVKQRLLEALWCVVVLIGSGLAIATYQYFYNPASWYAGQYGTVEGNVVVNKRPHDCEFMTAPVGDKHCHYVKKVSSGQTSGGAIWVYVSYEKVEE